MAWWLSMSQRSSSALLLSVLSVSTGLMQKSAITADDLQSNEHPVSSQACELKSLMDLVFHITCSDTQPDYYKVHCS